jgi:hypothetical protein
MKVIFCRSHLPGSYAIRALTFSRWSHVALILPDGRVLEATWPKVQPTTVEAVIAAHSAYEIRELGIPEHRIPWLLDQVGKYYDLGALAMYLNPWRDWTENDRWFCSELLAAAMDLFNEAGRVSPQMLYLVSRPIKLPRGE